MFKMIMFLLISLFCSFLCHDINAQCKEQSNPNKWLFKNGFGKVKVSYPQEVDYASKMVTFFDAFVIFGVYSFVLKGEDKLFYLQYTGPASYLYTVNESDTLKFHFTDNEVIKLLPRTRYDGVKGALMAFYKIDPIFLNKLSQTDLDSMVLNFTPMPKKSELNESKLANKFTFKNFSDKHVKLFKEHALCAKRKFYNE